MFSSRVPADLTGNRIAHAVERMRAAGRAFIDLTESNPTRAAFDYPVDLLAPLAVLFFIALDRAVVSRQYAWAVAAIAVAAMGVQVHFAFAMQQRTGSRLLADCSVKIGNPSWPSPTTL